MDKIDVLLVNRSGEVEVYNEPRLVLLGSLASLRGVLKGDLKGWESLEELSSLRRLGAGVDIMYGRNEDAGGRLVLWVS